MKLPLIARGAKTGFLALAALGLGACAAIDRMADDGFSDGPNYAVRSPLGLQLTSDEKDALRDAFETALATGEPREWRAARARGSVAPKGYALVGLKSDEAIRVPSARGDLTLPQAMETDLGLYVLTRNANVRTGPGTDFKAVETLSSGQGVDALGRVVDRPWMLVAVDGVARGFVYANLMIKAPGAELELAGGPERRARACREFEQRLRVGGEEDRFRGAACRDGDGGWRLAPPAPGEYGGPALLRERG